jgi:hypothetical protein
MSITSLHVKVDAFADMAAALGASALFIGLLGLFLGLVE